MRFYTKEEIDGVLNYPSLIEALKGAFIGDSIVPPRHHHDFKNPKEGIDSTLLLMPAWKESESLGVKVVTVSPNNAKYDMPSIQGIYLLFNAQNGKLDALLDGKALTAKRTAASYALGSSFLTIKDSSSLLMIGTGALSIELIRAHASVRPIKDVFVWGRDINKAKKIANELKNEFNIIAVETILEVISKVDIISCATLSKTALVLGENLVEGQHIDLVGAYKPDMREANDALIKKVDIFIDTPMALKETGDLKIPLEQGTINKNDIQADLFDLSRKKHLGRNNNKQITLFKSVGHALEDLAAAILVKEKLIDKN